MAIVVAAYFIAGPIELFIFHSLTHAFNLRSGSPNTLIKSRYGTLMLVRLLLNSVLWVAVCKMLNRSAIAFPLNRRRFLRHTLVGLATGLAVMLATMFSIWGLEAAVVTRSGQTLASACGNGFAWLILDFVGALGEELYGRAIVLVVAERFLGWRGAVLVSGLMFSGFHLDNPGASRIWLFRLFAQGCVLAYATFRSRSIWWSVGYHTGWNWISAPLFGAAGSGYLDEGHLFNFAPHGSIWITGGAVGPEGSIFAFVAVFVALGLLFITTSSIKKQKRADCQIVAA
ncbi:CPBP family intramembrane glutamic endopeptidase [Granulicella tundricola]|uniref:CPBP family intramembrane glutamic endopeptidase n=1 Tax=Granulicella tundricola TaxID=940615 RepID=UPI000674126C|nr:CPBP family intramembrane glutamic endopeptidase [Granulicella tundricola]